MNFFDLHIGDYEAATAHLSMLEDAAYCRMLRIYYRTEKPLPADVKQVQRLVRAVSKAERDAVQQVLADFFELRDDGWHQHRCDAEIERYADGEPEREVKKANEDNRLRKHRAERAELFKKLTDAGHHAAWNIPISDLRELVKRVTGPAAETPAPPLPATAPATPATATQYPLPTTQTPEVEKKPPSDDGGGEKPAASPPAPPTAKPTQADLLGDLPDCPHEAIIAAFHEALPAARHVRDWTPARSQVLRARWREDRKRQNLEWWRRFFAYCAQSAFLTGRTSTVGRRPFELSLDWLVKSENFVKVREGAYHEAQDVTQGEAA